MASQSLLGLPPLSAPLKPITPYLQRAHELRTQDPIMAYWCAYHAAQLGISLKAKDTTSRDVLFELLGVLECLKKEIGPHDALDIEAVSSAYVENFALKVFAMADNEDRTGNATRSTAKKFLAAANFLEVLKIFPKTEISESAEEKIRYAKWKAADIAKAFREGRKPTPGPAKAEEPQDLDTTPPASPFPHTQTTRTEASRSSQRSETEPDRSIKRASPPSHIDVPPATQAPFAAQPQTPPRYKGGHLDVNSYGHERGGGWGGEGEATPGSWSTAATPGTAQEFSVNMDEPSSPMATKGHKPRRGSGTSGGGGGGVGISRRKAWVSEELEPHDGDEHYASHQNGGTIPGYAGTASSDDSSNTKRSVHFTPSVDGGLSDSSVASSSAPTTPSHDERESDRVGDGHWASNPTHGDYHLPQPGPHANGGIDLRILPPGFVPDPNQVWVTGPGAPPPPHIPQGPAHNHDPFSLQHDPAPGLPPTRHNMYAPSAPPLPQHYAPPPPSPPSPDELPPLVIAKAQKHCRFAISALDYEDAATARKELRTALAILGG
ncbi:putative vta1 like [Lyophyllum shimeji]|uniref:Vta1 like n=1 Tax=Lyophyllum shimeji TaxID=47721 RepID=A0A9P3PH64_LYOSH|nr:putative vta1 like [Lyophyllum shimeji]